VVDQDGAAPHRRQQPSVGGHLDVVGVLAQAQPDDIADRRHLGDRAMRDEPVAIERLQRLGVAGPHGQRVTIVGDGLRHRRALVA
jgi:hypothetical protein